MKFPIYLDNLATTPVDPRVLDAMLPFLRDKFGNIGSDHLCGRDVVGPVAQARQHVADLLNSKAKEIIFTSGATESNNLAIKGAACSLQHLGRHIITQSTEHKAVLDTCHYLEMQGFEITFLKVDPHGKITPDLVLQNLRKGKKGTKDRTILISIMTANNEIGTIQPIKEIAKALSGLDIVFHTDAAQAAGKISIDLREMPVDLLSISAHKMYGPKGIGALFVRQGVNLECQMHGGGQEFGLRSGTLAVPMVVALGEACKLAKHELEFERTRLTNLRDQLYSKILAKIPDVKLNGHPTERLPGNLHLTFNGIEGEKLLMSLQQVCCSSTSACTSHSGEPSHVLTAIGLSQEQSKSSLRLGLGRFTTVEEIDYAADRIIEAAI